MAPDVANTAVQQRALQILRNPGSPAGAVAAPPSNSPVATSSQPIAALQGGPYPAPTPNDVGPSGGLPPQRVNSLMPPQPINSLTSSSAAPAAAPPQPFQQAQSQQQAQGPAPFNPMAGLPPGAKPITVGMAGLPFTQGAPPGYAWAQTPDGGRVSYPIVQPALKFEKTPTEITGFDPRSGQVVSHTPITESGRMVFQQTPTGTQGFMNGHAVGAPIPFSGRAEQNEAYQGDQKSVNGIIGIAQQAQTIAPRLNEMADLAKQLYTGPTAQSRGNAQAYLETLGVDPAAASRLTGMSSAAAFQEFTKLAMSTAGAAAKDDLGANNGVQAMGMYMGSNPNPNLVQGANVNITNMMRVLNQSKQDYAQAALDHFKTQQAGFLGSDGQGSKPYTPLTAFNQAWLGQNNPHVYAAAMGMLNGDPFDKWSARLNSPAEGARAAGIVSRIDPQAMVPVKGGMIPVRQLLAKIPDGQAQSVSQ